MTSAQLAKQDLPHLCRDRGKAGRRLEEVTHQVCHLAQELDGAVPHRAG